ncbi:DUF3515 family protein [Solwaraspora sp. WMMD406]|uniref:DUF3515 family protein n=1 Tax=Solwaraspora sp. WMMD406 TaxID=3016095 RepID=UPI002417917A|nr:DUF3515 family protein [Solwaraspora sp. WMMD406]MDG4767243.1 DUF3515 family protein [Solwaraspora sp. WMMD406]
MTDQLTPPTTSPSAPQPAPGGSDRTTRQAAIWATVVALPLTLIVAFAALSRLAPADPADPGTAPDAAAAASGAPGAGPDAGGSAAPVPTAPVPMEAAALDERSAIVCRALLSQLPGTLRDLRQRLVSAGAEQNAAYGEPPITVACGVPAATFPPTDLVYPLDGVCWHAAEQPAGEQPAGEQPAGEQPAATVWTTVDREVPVRVTVPGSYDEPGQWVIALSDTLIETVPSDREAAPRGCRP